MKPVDKPTLARVADTLAAHDWDETQLDELVAPRRGVITGFQDLLDDLERLRRVDLGATPPAGPVARPKPGE